MTEEIIIDVSGCPHKCDDECMEVPICNEYGDLMDYQSCEAQTLCPYRSQKKIERLEQLKNKYYQQTLDDEITISDLIEEIQGLKADRTLERISKLSIENAHLEQENKELKKMLSKEPKAMQAFQIAYSGLKKENEVLWGMVKDYKTALEEIKTYLSTLSSIDNDFPNTETYLRIQDKINEVLK